MHVERRDEPDEEQKDRRSDADQNDVEGHRARRGRAEDKGDSDADQDSKDSDDVEGHRARHG